jgi:hypothetical protein
MPACLQPGCLHWDFYMDLADVGSYLDADQRLRELHGAPPTPGRKVILNGSV